LPTGPGGIPQKRRKPRPKKQKGCSNLDLAWLLVVGGFLVGFSLWCLVRGPAELNADWPSLRGGAPKPTEETSPYYHVVKGIGAPALAGGRRSDVRVFDKDQVDRSAELAEVLANQLEEETFRRREVRIDVD
jgi:hypothetical protein